MEPDNIYSEMEHDNSSEMEHDNSRSEVEHDSIYKDWVAAMEDEDEVDMMENEMRVKWTEDEQNIIKKFIKEKPSIAKNDERGKKHREKLMEKLSEYLFFKFTDDEIHLKIIDLSGKWRSEDIDTVISFYQNRPFLWDPSLIEYRNKRKRNMALEELAKKIQFRKAAQDISIKFEGLKTTYCAAKKRGTTGSGGKAIKVWPYFHAMSFINTVSCQRPSYNNVGSENIEENSTISESTDLTSTQETLFKGSSSVNSQAFTTPTTMGTKRRHSRTVDSTDDLLKQKIISCLDTKETAADAFGKHISEVLKQFSPVNQELVKANLQIVLSKCLQCEVKDEDIPNVKFI